MATVALTYNAIRVSMLMAGPPDSIAEYDSAETIDALSAALRAGGHQVIPLEADESIAEQLRAVRPDVVFNIAEGLRGESRESHVPAICAMLGLPYTGSGPLTLALCLNKARAKQILSSYRIVTPRFQVFTMPAEALDPSLRFPLIAKLLHEGSSMGLSADSVVVDEARLRRQAAHLLRTYRQPVLVEEFIEGREFTVGVIGNDPPQVLPITESIFDLPRGIVLFEPDDEVLPLLDAARKAGGLKDGVPWEAEESLRIGRYRSVCPADTDPQLTRRIEETAIAAFRALDCRDWCRMEMRLGADGRLYVLELNPIAGIDPSYWLPRAALAAGLTYEVFVNRLLDYALERAKL